MKKQKLFCTLLITLLVVHASDIHAFKKNKADNQVWITIFIHGTIGAILRNGNLNLLFTLLQDSVENSQYKRATAHVRRDPSILKEQAIQGLGLKKIDKKNIAPGKAATALALIFDKLDFWLHGRKKELNYYYTQGWSGLVSCKERYKEAKLFYAELADLIEEFEEKGINPKIRIIGYSHGGSMGLNLAKVAKKEKPDKTFFIDELVLLGMPVSNRALDAVNHPMFKKVYNIYSKSDGVQTLDFTLPGTTFSKRFFVETKKRSLPEKLTQIQLKMIRNRTTRKSWKKSEDPRRKTDKNIFLCGNAELLRKISPSHAELWFFDWVRTGYRTRMPLKPLPVAALLPTILHESKKCTHCSDVHQVIELRPEHETMIVNAGQGRHARPLLSEKKLNTLKKLAHRFAVKRQTQEEYKRLAKSAIRKAVLEIRAEKKKKLSRADFIPQIEEIFHRQLLSTLTEYEVRNLQIGKVCLL